MLDSADFLLVHSPLVGPSTWSGVAEELIARGRGAVVPSLRTSARSSGPFWSRQAKAAVSAAADSGQVLIVGHSGAGALLPVIGQGLGERLTGYVFVDAGLPTCGGSWLDSARPALVERLRALVKDGLVPPWHEWFGGEAALTQLLPDADERHAFVAELDPLPWEMLQEARPPCPEWPQTPVGYLRLSEGYDADADAAENRGWPCRRIDGHHLSTVTEPGRIVDDLLELEKALAGPLA
ncbi:MAG: hypothetical protein QOK14_1870 [Frankiaceae bacterium]|nr:hypothetical protein [Frankiaceae bacterium]